MKLFILPLLVVILVCCVEAGVHTRRHHPTSNNVADKGKHVNQEYKVQKTIPLENSKLGSFDVYTSDTLNKVSANPIIVVLDSSSNFDFLALSETTSSVVCSVSSAGTSDVVAVLKWLKDYSKSIHGDPSNVSVLGKRQGASLATRCLCNDETNDLFHKVILIEAELRGMQEDKTSFENCVLDKPLVINLNRRSSLVGASSDKFLHGLTDNIKQILTYFYKSDLTQEGSLGHISLDYTFWSFYSSFLDTGAVLDIPTFVLDADNVLSNKHLLKSLGSFVHTGSPSTNWFGEWQPFSLEFPSYTKVVSDSATQVNFGQKLVRLWTRLLPQLENTLNCDQNLEFEHAKADTKAKQEVPTESSGFRPFEEPLVTTQNGDVLGVRHVDEKGGIYNEFLGIPFATPPVGDLRFRKPLPPQNWEGVLEADEFGPHCTQFVAVFYPLLGMSNETSEDCLHLNVWVPEGIGKRNERLPVMFWIYGGAYILGTTAMYPGEALAQNGNVIVVSANYRVSTLGWLSTEDEAAPGNYGLWDIEAALQWVQANIAAFGGDPNSVTVFGQSAGGSMTSHVAISPATDKLLHRAIAISGGSTGFIGTAGEGAVADSTQTLARFIGCRRTNHTWELVNCLREEDAGSLDFWGVVSVIIFKQQLPNWIPVVDGDFVPQHPRLSWVEGAGKDKDLITGHTTHDSAGFVLLNPIGLPFDVINLAGSLETLDFFLGFVLNPYPNGDDAKEAIYTMYPGLLENDTEIRTQAAVQMTTDWWFASPAHLEANLHSESGGGRDTYVYDFNYRQSFLGYPDEWVQGSHIDDLYSVLGKPFMKIFRDVFLGADFNEDDLRLSDELMTFYSNFARTGNPNEGQDVPYIWPAYDSESRQYARFANESEIKQEDPDYVDRMYFWTDVFPNIADPPEPTCEKEDPWETITEQDIDGAIEQTKYIIRSALGEDPQNMWQGIEEFIDEVVFRRKARLEGLYEDV